MSNSKRMSILFVDDEVSILKALKRLLRSTGYRIHIAESGGRGLDLLEEHDIDVVVSDMRMPQMDGAKFLTEVARRWPNTVRMLLTGYADLSSAIDAINCGAISRYLTKPWQDDDLILCIRQAVERKQLIDEKFRLQVLTARQNHKLQSLNDNLEAKVKVRTAEIEAAHQEVAAAHLELRAGYAATVKVFSRLVQSRTGLASQFDVASDCLAVAAAMGLSADEKESLHQAALLCDIGKLGLPDEVVSTPYVKLDVPLQLEFRCHPLVAEATLVSLDQLSPAAEIIRGHCERLDGSGFPDKLRGDEIPLPARILGVTKMYADLLEGRIYAERYTVAEAVDYLVENSGTLFDAQVVNHFCAWLADRNRRGGERRERKLSLGALRAGMTVSRDLYDASGCLILAEGLSISDRLIDRLAVLQKSMGQSFRVHVEECAR